MAGIKNNRRTKYTIDAIETAFLHLLRQNPIDKITVTEICQEADVNRGTFYRYFKDPYDCLDQIQSKFFNELLKKRPKNKEDVSVKEVLTSVLTIFKQNADLMKALLLNDQSFLLERLFLSQDHLVDQIDPKSLQNPNKRQAFYAQTFYMSGTANIVRGWLALDMPEAPADLADYIVNLLPDKGRHLPDVDHDLPKLPPTFRKL
ncbi:hypothetical protein IV38_GL001050 [Lactobacillus selangorensis]|uniref:HTH tetR-type domain-containing protein n=1 Tax=Lactobacillus selangorensis TaxID=81857 RepID=A0A0R2FYY3_9LACO|nr:TetR/AcrR family transcriptional regulator [Lactobacillus selangorensis]KRN28843.1 hypothetical protein IV38_GL001050 [Lactobacillus selangorensis]KRN32747.1 hypothetical protein IV40_GL000803 [Lactobacillus selangorensis]